MKIRIMIRFNPTNFFCEHGALWSEEIFYCRENLLSTASVITETTTEGIIHFFSFCAYLSASLLIE
jgi:hypothetical protein